MTHMPTLTLAPTTAEHLQLVQVLGVYWMEDDLAGEQGYGLHYCFAQGIGTGITLLADERSEHDAPLYIGDWVRLRGIGQRRHTLVDNLTHVRAADAVRVDWATIALERHRVAPAQLLTEPESGDTPDAAAPLLEAREQQLAAKYPAVASFLDQLERHRSSNLPAPAPSDAAWAESFTNGGW